MNFTTITQKEYAENLEKLLSYALNNNSYRSFVRSVAAAEIFLSLLFGRWEFNLFNLLLLKKEQIEVAMKCIRGRKKFIIYPKSVVNDANLRIKKLITEYT